jgi:hypothetical protein
MDQHQPTASTRDGFQVLKDRFTVPKGAALDLQTKRAFVICHFFLNRNMAVADVVWLLDEDARTVILTLIEQGILQERRSQPRPAPQEGEPRKTMATVRTTELYTRLRS